MEQLKESIKNFSEEQLLDQYLNHRDEYIPEAVELMENEITTRGLREKIEAEGEFTGKNRYRREINKDEFLPFDHVFNHVDIELAASVLVESEIPFFADNPQSSDTLPLEAISERQFTIHVHKDEIEKAHELLDEHFEKIDGRYQMKKMSIKNQLKSLSFTTLHMTEQEALEKIPVQLTLDEKELIIKYGKRLLEEVDTVEKQHERVVFYYDSIEELLQHLLDRSDELLLSKTELVTILEILQIYCDEEDFPGFIDESIETLLGFFQQPA